MMTEEQVLEKLRKFKDVIVSLKNEISERDDAIRALKMSLDSEKDEHEAEIEKFKIENDKLSKQAKISEDGFQKITEELQAREQELADVKKQLENKEYVKENNLVKYRFGTAQPQVKEKFVEFIKSLYKDSKIESDEYVLNLNNSIEGLSENTRKTFLDRLLSIKKDNESLIRVIANGKYMTQYEQDFVIKYATQIVR